MVGRGGGWVSTSLKKQNKNNFPSPSSPSALNLSREGTKSRLIRFHFVVIFVFSSFHDSFLFPCLAYSPYSHPGSIYHIAISKVPSPFLAGKPLEHLCIVAARLHSGPHLRHLSSFVLTFYLPLPCVKPYLQCPL